jgi:asparagine synthase (glutamine-hydrolysing)
MCGICGIFDRRGRPVSEAVLDAMTRSLAHRGPDGHGRWSGGSVAFGHRRLAIRDLSPRGRQPMSDPSGRVTVTYNGELYNDKTLRRELETKHGYVFSSDSDTEVIPAGYLAWGEEVFERLEGMFAVGLWDAASRRLVLARDSMGIKPLYYSEFGGVVRFASEIKGLLADPAHPRALDAAALHEFLGLGYVGGERTMIDGVRQVEPGQVVSFDAAQVSARRYWRPRRRARFRRFDEAVEAFLPLWREVVGDHLVSDVPVGLLQSGGIDSSLVAFALAGQARFPLFTAAFQSKTFDESERARMVAERTGHESHLVPVGDDSDPAETLRSVVHHADGHLADESATPLLLLTRALSAKSKVALTGDGADELFGGYPTYRAARVAASLPFGGRPAEWLGRFFYNAAPSDESRLPATAKLSRFLLAVAAGRAHAHAEWRRYLPDFLVPEVYGPALRPLIGTPPTAAYRAALDGTDGEERLDSCLIADQAYHLPGGLLVKSDRMSMANGVEIRVPFLDRRIVEFASSCHSDLIVPLFGESKPLLRRALARYGAPAEVVRAAKRGFNAPLAANLRGPLRSLCDEVFGGASPWLHPYLEPRAVQNLWIEHRDRRSNHAYALWPMLTLALWRQSLENVSSANITVAPNPRARGAGQAVR